VPETNSIAWRAVVYETPVTTADGARVGTVREMLGSDAEDIFHGIRVRLTAGHRDVMIRADDVSTLTAGGSSDESFALGNRGAPDLRRRRDVPSRLGRVVAKTPGLVEGFGE
jgi:hypothetical protein